MFNRRLEQCTVYNFNNLYFLSLSLMFSSSFRCIDIYRKSRYTLIELKDNEVVECKTGD